MTIAIPDHPFYTPLLANAESIAQEFQLRLLRSSEDQCTRLLHNNVADLALLSPLGYGKGVVVSDYRILPSTMCILKGWTNTAGVFFRSGLESITTVASPSPEDFLMQAGMIVLEEQFDMECNLESASGSVADILQHYDAAIAWRGSEAAYEGMDVSEEWEMAFDAALPLALWVCRSESAVDADERGLSLLDITRRMAHAELAAVSECVEEHPHGDTFARMGEIQWQWHDETESILEQNLSMLFYHQLVSEIPAVKIWGRD